MSLQTIFEYFHADRNVWYQWEKCSKDIIKECGFV